MVNIRNDLKELMNKNGYTINFVANPILFIFTLSTPKSLGFQIHYETDKSKSQVQYFNISVKIQNVFFPAGKAF